MSFSDSYPTPDHESATARQVAGWVAVHSLYLMGRADRVQDDEGRGHPDALNLLSLAGAESQTAQALWAHFAGVTPDRSARLLLTGTEAGESIEETACEIARCAGHDPDKARTAGYES